MRLDLHSILRTERARGSAAQGRLQGVPAEPSFLRTGNLWAHTGVKKNAFCSEFFLGLFVRSQGQVFRGPVKIRESHRKASSSKLPKQLQCNSRARLN